MVFGKGVHPVEGEREHQQSENPVLYTKELVVEAEQRIGMSAPGFNPLFRSRDAFRPSADHLFPTQSTPALPSTPFVRLFPVSIHEAINPHLRWRSRYGYTLLHF